MLARLDTFGIIAHAGNAIHLRPAGNIGRIVCREWRLHVRIPAILSLEALDAQGMLELMRHVSSWFGDRVPETIEERNAAIASWADFEEEDTADREQIEAGRVDQALSAYIVEHRLADDDSTSPG